MLFNSASFLVFFAVVFCGYWTCRHRESQLNWLLVLSFVFYASWSWHYAWVFLGLVTLNYWLCRAMHRNRRRPLLVLLLIIDLSFLAWHKYAVFAVESLATAAGLAGVAPPPWRLPEIVLPVGISFYTFQLIACAVDIWRGHAPLRCWRDFALFVMFFPHQLAGPIFRIDDLVPQFERKPHWAGVFWREGMWWLMLGFCKKVFVADSLAPLVETFFADPAKAKNLFPLFGVYGFAFQIYCDFSGYSNIARGLGLLLGFDILHNFRCPYFARNPREFWQRWHVSLSRWLRDYLYIPLGGNRGGFWNTCRNLMLTMGLGGLWHGANWTFVAWGVFHGLWLVCHRGWERLGLGGKLAGALLILGTFHLVCLGWVLFRAESLDVAWVAMWEWCMDWDHLTHPKSWARFLKRQPQAFVALCLAVAGHGVAAVCAPERWWRLPPWVFGLGAATIVMLLIVFAPENREFIYFQF